MASGFNFKITVKDVDAAEAKVMDYFEANKIKVKDRCFSGEGFSGNYSVGVNSGGSNEVSISILEKPTGVFDWIIKSAVKSFLKGV